MKPEPRPSAKARPSKIRSALRSRKAARQTFRPRKSFRAKSPRRRANLFSETVSARSTTSDGQNFDGLSTSGLGERRRLRVLARRFEYFRTVDSLGGRNRAELARRRSGWGRDGRLDDMSKVRAFAWDKETNVLKTLFFFVPHYRSTKNGRNRITDERDLKTLRTSCTAPRDECGIAFSRSFRKLSPQSTGVKKRRFPSTALRRKVFFASSNPLNPLELRNERSKRDSVGESTRSLRRNTSVYAKFTRPSATE